MSATRAIISSSRSRFFPVFAETSTVTVSPPQSSASSPCSDEFALHAVDVDARLIDLVDRDDERNFRRARVMGWTRWFAA